MVQQNNNTPARLFAVQFIYQVFLKENTNLLSSLESASFDQINFEALVNDFVITYQEPDNEHPDASINAYQIKYGKEVLNNLVQNYPFITKTLESSIKSTVTSLTPFDRSALLVGITEMKFLDVPFQVVINELVNICKVYGSETSAKFINGVLDGIGKSK